MLKLILGVIKGGIIGGAVGYGAYVLGLTGAVNWFTYCTIGFLVGFLVGKPVWKHLSDSRGTIWTPILKGLFGVAFAAGAYAIVAKAWGGFNLALGGESHNLYNWQFIMGGVIGAIYGAFVEVDDAESASAQKKLEAPKKG